MKQLKLALAHFCFLTHHRCRNVVFFLIQSQIFIDGKDDRERTDMERPQEKKEENQERGKYRNGSRTQEIRDKKEERKVIWTEKGNKNVRRGTKGHERGRKRERKDRSQDTRQEGRKE